jgi:predicted nuclease of predicted toxin-antitoxin system
MAGKPLKFLVDYGLSPQFAAQLVERGFDAVHVRALGFAAAADEVIFHHAAEDDRVVVSLDTDFGTLLASASFLKPSVILFRTTRKSNAVLLITLMANVDALHDDLLDGAIAVIEDGRIRVRRLPILGAS